MSAVTWAPYTHLGAQSSGAMLRRFAVGGADKQVHIYRSDATEGYVREQTLDGHSDWVRDVAWAPATGLPMNILASCGEEGRVIIHKQRAEKGEWEKAATLSFEHPVWRLSWSVTGNILAVSGGDNNVTLWKEDLSGKWSYVLASLHTVSTPRPCLTHPSRPYT